MAERGAHQAMGFHSVELYAKARFHKQPRTTRLYRPVGRALLELPEIDRVLCDGRLFWSQACELVKVATPATELEWIEGPAPEVIARAARDTPRDALALLHSARDEAQLRGLEAIGADTALSVLESMGIDPAGLKRIERQCLLVLEEARGPVGLRTLADRLGKSRPAIQTVHEPFLVRRGLVRRTRAGRVRVPQPRGESTGSSSPAA